MFFDADFSKSILKPLYLGLGSLYAIFPAKSRVLDEYIYDSARTHFIKNS